MVSATVRNHSQNLTPFGFHQIHLFSSHLVTNLCPSQESLWLYVICLTRVLGVRKMADPFTRFSWWLLGGKEREPAQNGSSLNSSLDWGFDWGFSLREPDCAKFPSVRGANKIASSSRKVRRKWQSREERRIDKEYDVVLVPSDGVCLSGSESDDSDWSIGWSEPHGPDFHSDNESENSFAVLVPCYRPGCKEVAEGSNNQLLSAIKNLQNEFSPEGKNYMDHWLSSLQNC